MLVSVLYCIGGVRDGRAPPATPPSSGMARCEQRAALLLPATTRCSRQSHGAGRLAVLPQVAAAAAVLGSPLPHDVHVPSRRRNLATGRRRHLAQSPRLAMSPRRAPASHRPLERVSRTRMSRTPAPLLLQVAAAAAVLGSPPPRAVHVPSRRRCHRRCLAPGRRCHLAQSPRLVLAGSASRPRRRRGLSSGSRRGVGRWRLGLRGRGSGVGIGWEHVRDDWLGAAYLYVQSTTEIRWEAPSDGRFTRRPRPHPSDASGLASGHASGKCTVH
jgi:hypothetical protein